MKELKKDKIESLQALRAIAFIGVFLLHALRAFVYLDPVLYKTGFVFSYACLGVSIFFVLSGFLMMYKHKNDKDDLSIKNNIKNAIKRIKSLYPLHIITMILGTIIIFFRGYYSFSNLDSIKELIYVLFLNITLLQSWIPDTLINTSLNGVAWYLSVSVFLYFMFPYIKKFIKYKNNITLGIISIIWLLLEIVSCYLMIKVYGVDSKVYNWFMYCFPLFRLGDFFMGCSLERVYSSIDKEKISTTKATIYEIITIILIALVFIYYRMDHTRTIFKAINNMTTIYIPVSLLLVLLFAINKGLITKLLNNKLLIYIGNISSYLFLIHYVVTQGAKVIIINNNIKGYVVLIVLIELLLSILLSNGYKYVHKKLLTRKEK